jgi:hypothetical protein
METRIAKLLGRADLLKWIAWCRTMTNKPIGR